jgi:hypothetical protein
MAGTAAAGIGAAGLGGYAAGRGLNALSGGRIDRGMQKAWQPVTDRMYGVNR